MSFCDLGPAQADSCGHIPLFCSPWLIFSRRSLALLSCRTQFGRERRGVHGSKSKILHLEDGRIEDLCRLGNLAWRSCRNSTTNNWKARRGRRDRLEADNYGRSLPFQGMTFAHGNEDDMS